MRDSIPLKNTHRFLFSLLLVLAIVGYETIAPLLVTLRISDYSDGIAFVKIVMLLISLYGFLLRGGKLRRLLYALIPYLLFRFAFLARLVDNVYFSDVTLYLDTYLVFVIFFCYGLIPSLSIAKNATYVNEQSFARIMEFSALLFVVGILLNYNSVFNTGAFRVGLDSLNAISLTGAALTFILYFSIYFRYSRRTKIIAIAVLPIIVAVAALSKSRGPILATIVAATLYFFLARRENRRAVLVGIAVIVALAMIAQFIFGIDLMTALFGRFQFSSSYDADLDLSGNTRQVVWLQSWRQFLDMPIFGELIVESRSGGYPHNIVLESLISMGVFGIILLTFYVASMFKHCVKLIRDNHSSLIINLIIILFFKELIGSLFSGNLIGNSELWILSCFIVARSLQANSYRRQTN